MKVRDLHRPLAALLAAGLLVAGAGVARSQPATATAGWCRIDDPGAVEAERVRKGLGLRDVDQVACAAATPAQSLPEELILPLPCGRRMVLRKVTLTVAHLLDHREVFLGTVFDEKGGAEQLARDVSMSGPRSDLLAGSFTKQLPTGQMERSYYVGKYELSAPQYALLQDRKSVV